MKTRNAILLICIYLLAAGSGYWFRGVITNRPPGIEGGVLQAAQECSAIQSFSEVENTKSVLDSLSYEFSFETHFRHQEALRNRGAAGTDACPDRAKNVEQYVTELREGIAEFQCTKPEMRLVQTLLLTLKAEQRYGQWLDLYLDTLYRHPTHDLVGNLAGEAAWISRAVARQEELGMGLQHLLQVPFPFDAKLKVGEALEQCRQGTQLATSGYR
jgi:hypothetical protein